MTKMRRRNGYCDDAALRGGGLGRLDPFAPRLGNARAAVWARVTAWLPWAPKRRRIHPGPNVNDSVSAFLLVYMGLFPIINPIGGAPIFLGLTRHCIDEERHSLARRVAINGFFLMLGSLIVGSHVLEFFGITLPIVRIAGGLVVTAFGWKLLQAGPKASTATRSPRPAGHPDHRTPFIRSPCRSPLGQGRFRLRSLGTQRPRAANLYDLIVL